MSQIARKIRKPDAIRAWREAAKVSLEQIAVAGDVCLRTVQRWEAGVIEPRIGEILLVDAQYPGFLKACCKAFV